MSSALKATKATKPASSNSRFANPTPYQLRILVMDYLRHHGYTVTALALARDSAIRHVDADGDEIMSPDNEQDPGDAPYLTAEMLQQVELREQVRMQILNGQVEAATDILNKELPSVLSDTSTEVLPPERRRSSDEVVYVAPTSVDPAHLNLNLRFLSFIEAVRTVPLPHVGNLPDVPSLPHIEHAHDPEVVASHKADLITRAQKLYASAQMLQKPSDRATYLEEVSQVGWLMAHKVPEDSPVAYYLTQARREAVANQIDSAILYRMGLPVIPYVELYVRYVSTILGYLNDLGVKVSPFGRQPINLPTSCQKKVVPDKKEPEDLETVPPFDLKTFLDSKTQ